MKSQSNPSDRIELTLLYFLGTKRYEKGDGSVTRFGVGIPTYSLIKWWKNINTYRDFFYFNGL